MQISSIWLIDRTLSGATTSGQSGPWSNGNKEVLRVPQSSSITGTLPSDCLVSYAGHSWGKSYLSAEKQLVYSTPTPSRLGKCQSEDQFIFILMKTKHSVHIMMFGWLLYDGDIIPPFIFPHGLRLNTETNIKVLARSSCFLDGRGDC